jgi:hypothetical protein
MGNQPAQPGQPKDSEKDMGNGDSDQQLDSQLPVNPNRHSANSLEWGHTETTPAADPLYSSQSSTEFITQEGWLSKQTIKKKVQNSSPWKYRYFVLRRGFLHYYTINYKLSIYLNNPYTIEFDPNPSPEKLEKNIIAYMFTITSIGSIPSKPFVGFFAVESASEFHLWTTLIQQVSSTPANQPITPKKGWLYFRDNIASRKWEKYYVELQPNRLLKIGIRDEKVKSHSHCISNRFSHQI